MRLTGGNLAYELLHTEDYVFVGGSALLGRRPLARGSDAAHHTLLDASPDLPLFRYFLDARRDHADAAWTFGKLEYLGTIGAIRLRVLQGAGVAVLPRYFVAGDLRARRMVRIVPRTQLPPDAFRLIWRAHHPREAELRVLAGDLARLPLA